MCQVVSDTLPRPASRIFVYFSLTLAPAENTARRVAEGKPRPS